MASKANLAIYQGDDYAAVVTVTNTAPPDQVLAGYTARAQIREDVADASDEVVVEINTTVQSPQITLFIPASETTNLCGEYVWDLQIQDASGFVTTIVAGSVNVTQEITRA
jgi:hypothetical protein